MNTKPFISIVIPTRNSQAVLKECLQSIKHLNYPEERLEVLIVDGLSTDDTRKIAEASGTTIVMNHKKATTAARNLGFDTAKGELIAYSDDDCIFDKNWLENSLKYFQIDERVAGVTGPIHTPNQQNGFAKAVAFLFSLAVIVAKSTHREMQPSVQEVTDFPTCNAIYRTDALNAAMPLDENLYGGSDLELNYKLRQQGYKLLSTPDVQVWHYKRETPQAFFRQMYRYAVRRLQIGKKWAKLLNLAHVTVGLGIPLLIIFLGFSFWLNPNFVLLFIGSVLAALLFICSFAFFKTKSLLISLLVPVVIAILVTGWSMGFCRELVLPMRGVRANR